MGDFTVDVTVTLPDGRQATTKAAFNFTPVEEPKPSPIISSVVPEEGSVEGGTAVTITGEHFEEGATVTFGGRPAADVTVSEDGTTITCMTPSFE